MLKRSFLVAVAMCIGMIQTVATAADVSLSSLLDEMTDRAALARFPDPAYTVKQFSSYDPASVSPDKPGWFANNDRSFFVREETNHGRTEWVMMDAEGPGAIVRWWITGFGYDGTVRIYIDGATEPVIECKIDELVGGTALVGAPLSEERARGRNLYLPIPYAKRCKVTFDQNFQITKKREHLLYYQINYRTYSPGTSVEPFTMAGFEAVKDQIGRLQETLLDPASVMPEDATVVEREATIEAGASKSMTLEKEAAIQRLSVKLDAKDPVQALRSTILVVEFDGEPAVWCPVGDFFGSGVGVNKYKGWYRQIEADGTMTCWWVMPFAKQAKLSLENLGKQAVQAKVSVATTPWQWDDRSMHFRATWFAERNIETAVDGKKAFDWNYLTASGKGVFVGDSLALLNRATRWWGEGDEKIYVDGETFPSHFGTGTEDYYGYAWCTPEFFESPFHGQPRAEGPRNFGHITNTRVRLLDAIPFHESFRFDMEIWHWAATEVDYAVTNYWYGRPGAKATVGPMPDEAVQPVTYRTPAIIPGFKVLKSPPGTVELQNIRNFGRNKWKDDDQLWWQHAKPGDKLDLGISVEKAGRYALVLNMTKAPDYAIVQFQVNGKKAGEPVDFYFPSVEPADPVTLGPFDLDKGDHKLSIEIVGANDRARKSFMVGIDQIQIKPVD